MFNLHTTIKNLEGLVLTNGAISNYTDALKELELNEEGLISWYDLHASFNIYDVLTMSETSKALSGALRIDYINDYISILAMNGMDETSVATFKYAAFGEGVVAPERIFLFNGVTDCVIDIDFIGDHASKPIPLSDLVKTMTGDFYNMTEDHASIIFERTLKLLLAIHR